MRQTEAVDMTIDIIKYCNTFCGEDQCSVTSSFTCVISVTDCDKTFIGHIDEKFKNSRNPLGFKAE